MTTTLIENENHVVPMSLPGQTAAPAGPADLTMMYLMHHAFRRDLDNFVTAVGATPVADGDTWKALAQRWDRFAAVLHHHHTVEDTHIWPFLTQRAVADELVTLEAMEAEHELIDPLLESVAEGFAAMAAGGSAEFVADQRNALKVRVTAARESLARHLEHEETEALVILQRRTTHEEWEALEAVIDGEKHLPAPLPFLVGWIAEDLPAGELDRAFARAGKPFRVLWWLTRRSFRKGEAKAFKYVG